LRKKKKKKGSIAGEKEKALKYLDVRLWKKVLS
jgi:hypothetical protein